MASFLQWITIQPVLNTGTFLCEGGSLWLHLFFKPKPKPIWHRWG